MYEFRKKQIICRTNLFLKHFKNLNAKENIFLKKKAFKVYKLVFSVVGYKTRAETAQTMAYSEI